MDNLVDGWDQYFMLLAYAIAMKSKDQLTSVGCVIVGPDYEVRSTGYNNFVRGWNDEKTKNHKSPYKHNITEHAERNAIYNAARSGVSLLDCKMYTTLSPCVPCARAILQSGLNEVIYHGLNPKKIEDGDDIVDQDVLELFKGKNIKIRPWNGKIPRLVNRINGNLVRPRNF